MALRYERFEQGLRPGLALGIEDFEAQFTRLLEQAMEESGDPYGNRTTRCRPNAARGVIERSCVGRYLRQFFAIRFAGIGSRRRTDDGPYDPSRLASTIKWC